ncbi:hypothetical protein CAPTEDRAFT_217232 [Capitella teleta]|uniref:Uncharacterized protein n=1 Tax=Capitella teleta TaxID=283909 RepID=R7TAW3_CAPTE|nr:hypothetical protein CAPTEDRAFT_217232 [Capitella teleta]|eukprot:ELT90863.1 hypothetical protein CAPTEDRAFT_217232 [Capitella teleta]
MGNEQGKEVNDDLGETSAAESSNKMSFLNETTNFVNNTIRKLSNPNADQANMPADGEKGGSASEVKASSPKDNPTMDNSPTDAGSPGLNEETDFANINGEAAPATDKFNSKLKQTVLALNALRGTGDECHAFVVTNQRGQRLAGYHWKPRAFKIGGKKVRMPGGPSSSNLSVFSLLLCNSLPAGTINFLTINMFKYRLNKSYKYYPLKFNDTNI